MPRLPARETVGSSLAMARLVSRISATTAACCQEFGITLSQYRVLVWLIDRPMRATDLAEHLGVSRPAVSVIIRGLERRRLITKKTAPEDGRAKRLCVSRAGLNLVRSIDERLMSLVEAIVPPEVIPRLSERLGDLEQSVDVAATQARDRLRMARGQDPGAKSERKQRRA